MSFAQLSPCPFCTSTSVDVSRGDAYLAVVTVRCYSCGAEGPTELTAHEFTREPQGKANLDRWKAEAKRAERVAIEKWNRRSAV